MRDRGTFNFSGNLEVKKDAPLEARSLVNSYADLVKPETWTDEQGGIWKYDCMLVSCKDRPGKVYQLSPGADYTKESSWILIGDTSELNNKVQEFIDSKGAPNGLASLNESGIIPSAQLPSYVDDVIEVDTFSNLPGTGESGKIYIVQDTNLTYRWSGTAYVEISKSLALGETSSTAYPGDKGKATTDKLNKTSDKVVVGPTTVNPSTDKIVLKYQTHFTSTNSNSEDSHTINAATTSQAGLMSSSDKTKIDKIITNGNGTKYLSDNGTYKEVSGEGESNIYVFCPTISGNGISEQDYNNFKAAANEGKVILVPNTLHNRKIGGQFVPINYYGTSNFVLSYIRPLEEADGTFVSDLCMVYIYNTYEIGGTEVRITNAKNLIIPNVNTILRPVSLQGQDAQSKINELFSSAGNFKDVIEDILVNHTRYYFHFDNKLTNCIELGCVNAWRNDEKHPTSYILQLFTILIILIILLKFLSYIILI